jgi:ribose transport system substrate-binding protein
MGKRADDVKHMMRTLIYGTGFALTLASCGDGNVGVQNKVINRIPVPDSPFKPTTLEATIGSFVTEIGKTEAKDMQLSIVLKELTGYWEPVKTGANRAIGELDVPGVVVAPTEATPDERAARQVQMLAEQRQSGYNGFALAPLNSIVTPEIDAAADAGFPVVTVDSDLPESKRHLYVGTINAEAGKTAAATLKAQLGSSVTSGTVIVLGHDTGDDWPDGYQRSMGAKTALEGMGFTVQIRRSTWTDTGTVEDQEAMRQSIVDASPPVVGMIGVFSNAFRCAGAAEMAGKTGSDIAIVAFDFEPQTLSYMQSGLIRATHVQRQYYMGYLMPYLLYGINALGMEKTKQIMAPHMVDSARIDTGLDVVGASQVDAYNAFLDSLGIGAS